MTTVLNFADSQYVAHEIGHTLDAMHDKNNCEYGLMGDQADELLGYTNGLGLYNEQNRMIWDLKRGISQIEITK